MLPLFDADMDRSVQKATASLERFPVLFEEAWLDGMRSKLGLFTAEAEDKALVDDLLAWMQRTSADFTNTFRDLSTSARAEAARRADSEFEAWHARLDARRAGQPQSLAEGEALMRRSNPAFIPRNHKVEEALRAASAGDLTVMHQLLDVLSKPYDHDRDVPAFSAPGEQTGNYRTFCGT
jgi:uncharacterized protein YdiU (UPF0061 family)